MLQKAVRHVFLQSVFVFRIATTTGRMKICHYSCQSLLKNDLYPNMLGDYTPFMKVSL